MGWWRASGTPRSAGSTLSGRYAALSDTPGTLRRPGVWPGQDTRRILEEVGYSAPEIDALLASRAAEDTTAECSA